jgi:uncharacterized protein YbjT (DUF2867 family)
MTDAHKDHPKKDEHHKKEEVKSTIPARTIAVVGGTGHVGHSTALHLIKFQHHHHTAHKFHIGVRAPKDAKGLELAKHQGLVVGEADMSKPDTVASFLKDTDVALLVTPGAENRTALTTAAADAAKKAGVKHLVVVSLTVADNQDILFGKQFIAIENHVKKLGVTYTIVRLPMFTDNFMSSKASVVGQSTIYAPCKADAKFDVISVEDVGHFCACLMAGADLAKYENKTLNCTGPDAVTHSEIAAWFGESLKKDVKAIKFVTAKAEDAIKGMVAGGVPEWQAKGIAELYGLMDKDNAAVKLVTEDFKNVVGHKPNGPSTWIGHQGHHFIPHSEEHHHKKDDHKKEEPKK